jgi:hypothetical protein
MDNAYLCHHGVKGMRWGVRRYQNDNGTLTVEGRSRKDTYARPSSKSNPFNARQTARIHAKREKVDAATARSYKQKKEKGKESVLNSMLRRDAINNYLRASGNAYTNNLQKASFVGSLLAGPLGSLTISSIYTLSSAGQKDMKEYEKRYSEVEMRAQNAARRGESYMNSIRKKSPDWY